MTFIEVLNADDIYLDVELANKADIMEFLAERASEKGAPEAEVCRDALLDRERLGSTGLGKGIAIPHAQLAGLERPVALFVRLARPVEFGAADEEPVDLLLMVLMPTDHAPEHVKILAEFARIIRGEGAAGRLRRARTTQDVLQILGGA